MKNFYLSNLLNNVLFYKLCIILVIKRVKLYICYLKSLHLLTFKHEYAGKPRHVLCLQPARSEFESLLPDWFLFWCQCFDSVDSAEPLGARSSQNLSCVSSISVVIVVKIRNLLPQYQVILYIFYVWYFFRLLKAPNFILNVLNNINWDHSVEFLLSIILNFSSLLKD